MIFHFLVQFISPLSCLITQSYIHSSRTYAESRFTVVFWMMHPMSTTKCWLLKPIQILYYSCFFCANFRETYTMTRQGFEKDFFKESIMGFVSLDVIMMAFSYWLGQRFPFSARRKHFLNFMGIIDWVLWESFMRMFECFHSGFFFWREGWHSRKIQEIISIGLEQLFLWIPGKVSFL